MAAADDRKRIPRTCLLAKHYKFLKALAYCLDISKREGLKLLSTASSEEILSIIEVIANFLQENFPDNCNDIKPRLKKHKLLLRSLVKSSSSSSSVKRKLQNQTGGAILSSLLIPLIGSLIAAGVNKYAKI